MDENPYESPPAPPEAEISASTADHRPPPGLMEIVLFGGMVGVLYHSAAGFLLGIGLGVLQWLTTEACTVEQFVVRAMIYSLAGAMAGVASGGLLGSLAAILDSLNREAVVMRALGRVNVIALHILLGVWVGSFFFGAMADYPSYFPNEYSDSMFDRHSGLCLAAGVAFGSMVGALVDRRIRRTLARIRSTST